MRYLLHEAVKKGDIKVVKALIANGVDVNLQDNEGNTVLIIAAYLSLSKIAKILIKAGANIELSNNFNLTALVIARNCGYRRITKLLESRLDRLRRLSQISRYINIEFGYYFKDKGEE